ncbi:MAG: NYN domain-containing protein [Patescibacteria group bacterium]|jgi:uncharacterized LabA/DUF88 family protein
MKTVLLIDGENFKAKIAAVFKTHKKSRPTWHTYNFNSLFQAILSDLHIDHKIFYFAKIKEDPRTKNKSKQLIEEQRLLKTHLEKTGFSVTLSGRVRGHMENGALVFKEKGVDVKIAVDMVSFACDQVVKNILLASSDSDLQPAVQEIKKRHVNCIYIGFENQPNKGLTYTTQQTILIRDYEVLKFV